MGEDLSSLLSNMAELEIEIKEKFRRASEEPNSELFDEAANSSKRPLRKRSSSASEDSLHRTRNRKVEKPKKKTSSALQFENEKDLKNFYLNINKKVKLKPVLLETIQEKDETMSDIEESPTKANKRKVKRSLAICDGLNITKSLKEKRKSLIKKHLGGKKKPKKMALAKFMEYFKQKLTDTE